MFFVFPSLLVTMDMMEPHMWFVKVVCVDGGSLPSLVVDSRLTWWFKLPPQCLIVDGGDVEPSPPSGTRTPLATRDFKKLCFKTRLNPHHVAVKRQALTILTFVG
jgi:hypothetical protein